MSSFIPKAEIKRETIIAKIFIIHLFKFSFMEQIYGNISILQINMEKIQTTKSFSLMTFIPLSINNWANMPFPLISLPSKLPL